jgi:hypothetical protein
MSVIMRFGTRRAILCGARWKAADPSLERVLNDATKVWLRETGGPAIGDRDPDFTTALKVGVECGGAMHRHASPANGYAREVYLRARQLSMFE